MTKYLQSTPFSVGGGGNKAYEDGWNRIFAKKKICAKELECGGTCRLEENHAGQCSCEGDVDGPGTCPA